MIRARVALTLVVVGAGASPAWAAEPAGGAGEGEVEVDAAAAEIDGSDDAPACPKGACAGLRARLRRAGDRVPIAGATVLIFPAPVDAAIGEADDPAALDGAPAWLRRGESDALGDLVIDDLPPGRIAIEVIAADFVRQRIIVDLSAGEARVLKIFVRVTDEARYRTTVQSRRTPPRPAPFRRGLSPEEVKTLPGSQGDPLRALLSLPGFGRTPFGLGLLVLRGANPSQSQVFVGEHPVPRAFHLSGLSAIMPGDALARVDAVPGNFDAAYGNASAGVVLMDTRAGRRDGYHGSGNVDITGAGATAQGPLGKGSFFVGARRAYLDLPLRLVADINPQAPVIIPTYYDYQAFADFPLRRRASLHIGFLGAGDRFAIRASESYDEERPILFDLHTGFHRLDVAYRKRLGATRFLVTPALRFDRQRLDTTTSEIREDDIVTSYRAELAHEITPALTFVIGTDGLITRARTRTKKQMFSEEGIIAPVESASGELRSSIGFYSAMRVRLRRLDLDPGVRVAGFVVDPDADARAQDGAETQWKFAADPRLNGVFRANERWSIKGGVGLYSQSVRPTNFQGYGVGSDIDTGDGHVLVPSQLAAYFDPTRILTEVGVLRIRRALQASAGVAYRLPAGVTFEALGFVRDQDNGLPIPSAKQRPTNYRSQTLAYGAELLIRRELTRHFYGWIAYTLLWVRSATFAESDSKADRRVDDFDQRHNLVLAGSARLPRHWRIGGRFRFVTGSPYTPVIGAIQQGNRFSAIYGDANSDRFPVFYQLDLRIDREWTLRRIVVGAYLDLLNVTNAANTEAFIYSNDFRTRVNGVAMPILPAIGVRIDG